MIKKEFFPAKSWHLNFLEVSFFKKIETILSLAGEIPFDIIWDKFRIIYNNCAEKNTFFIIRVYQTQDGSLIREIKKATINFDDIVSLEVKILEAKVDEIYFVDNLHTCAAPEFEQLDGHWWMIEYFKDSHQYKDCTNCCSIDVENEIKSVLKIPWDTV